MDIKPRIFIDKDKYTREYRCRVRFNGKNNHIGYFKDVEALIFIKNLKQE